MRWMAYLTARAAPPGASPPAQRRCRFRPRSTPRRACALVLSCRPVAAVSSSPRARRRMMKMKMLRSGIVSGGRPMIATALGAQVENRRGSRSLPTVRAT